MTKQIWVIILSIIFIYIHAAPSALAAAKKIRVIALTDLHGALDQETITTKDGHNLRYGGAGLLSSYINNLRDQDKDIPTFLIDAGDIFQGSLVSNSVEGKPVINFYNYLKVDAVAIGNHEFDYGPIGPRVIPKEANDDPRGALKARIAEANFSFLAANIRQQDGNLPSWAKPSILLERGGVKIGVIGMATVSTPATTMKKNVEDLSFIDPVAPVILEAAKLREMGAQAIILAIHAGGGCKDNHQNNQLELSSCDPGELFEILDRLPPNTIDLAIGGHTHKGMVKFYKNIGVLQSFSHGRFISWADISLENKKVELFGPQGVCQETILIEGQASCDSYKAGKESGIPQEAEFFGKKVKPDSAALAVLENDFSRVEKMKSEPMGNAVAYDSFNRSYFDENNLANFFTEVLHHGYPNIDFVMLNNGGFRSNLRPGPLNFGHIYSIFPFDNQLAIVKMNGKELRKFISIGISREHGGYTWHGLTFLADNCQLLEINTTVDSSPIDDLKIYKVITVDFIAAGGSGFASLGIAPENIQFLEDGLNLRDSIIAALKTFPKQIKSQNFYDRNNLRQNIKNICAPK